MLALAAGFSLWLAAGLTGLLGLTEGVVTFCQSIFVKCLAYSHMATVGFLWFGATTFFVGLVRGLYKSFTGIQSAHRAVKNLPVKATAGRVVLIDDTIHRVAFTHGLIRPRIFISRGLIRGLTHDELVGVFLHELHHTRGLDPLKFFLVNLLKETFFYIPLLSHFSEYVRERGEGEADRSAAERMAGPLSLASALVKVARDSSVAPTYAATALTGVSGAKGAGAGRVEARIRRLIDGGGLDLPRPGKRAVAASFLVTAFLLLSFTLPLNAGVHAIEECTTEHCSTHTDRLGADCKTHCELPGHSH
jgi:Zn-dependent protease with chaperone function